MPVSGLTRQPQSDGTDPTLIDNSIQDNSATMIRCPTTSTTSSPRSENDNLSETTHTETSCDSYSTLKPPSSSITSPPCNCTAPITLNRIYQDNLSVEILTKFEELLPTSESYQRRMGLVRKIEKLLNAEWPNRDICVHLFGSSVNDLGTSYSDVDLCITTSWHELRNVRMLARLFRKCGMQQVSCVPRAKVPIVRLFDPESQLACDINVNNTLAIQNTRMIKTYVALDPRVRPLVMILKHWTKNRGLNDAANGGTLSSYTWTCMFINFLQLRRPPIMPVLHQLSDNEDDFFCDVEALKGFGDVNHESLGGLLYAFFRRFAVEFDYDEHVISVRHGRYLSKREKGWHVGRNSTSLCVEEPFNVSRNLGNSADVASVRGLRLEFCRALHLFLEGASLDVICEPYVPPLMSSLEPLPKVTVSPAVTSPENGKRQQQRPKQQQQQQQQPQYPLAIPAFVLPVHPHSIDLHPHERLRHGSVDNVYLQPSSLVSVTTPVSTPVAPAVSPMYPYEISYLYTPEARAGLRPRFHSTATVNYSPTPVIRMRGARHASHPASGDLASPTLLVPSIPCEGQSTQPSAPAACKSNDTRTLDSIFARYYDRKPSLSHSDNHGERRQSNAQDGHHRSNHNARHVDQRRTSNDTHTTHRQTRRKSSNGSGLTSSEWPSISPSSSAKSGNTRQHHGNQRRRRWSTVKKQQPQHNVLPEPRPTPPPPPQRLEEDHARPQPRVHFPRRRNSNTPSSAPPNNSNSNSNNTNSNSNSKTKKNKSHPKTT